MRGVLLWVMVALMPLAWAGEQRASVQLSWDGSSGATSYRIYYGLSPGHYTAVIDVGLTETASIGGLVRNQRYYFAATAVSADAESDFSNEVTTRARGT